MGIYFLTVGAPGSGKSTVAQYFQGVIVSPDQIRDSQGIMEVKEAYDIARGEIKQLLQDGKSVIFEATNCHKGRRVGMIEIGKPYADQVVCIWTDISLEACIARHYARVKRLQEMGAKTDRYDNPSEQPYETAIKRYWDQITADPPQLSEGFDYIIHITDR